MTTYRAAYITAPQSAGVVLTGPEHAGLADDALIAEAMAEAKRAGLIGGGENPMTAEQVRAAIRIGDWKE